MYENILLLEGKVTADPTKEKKKEREREKEMQIDTRELGLLREELRVHVLLCAKTYC